MPTKLGNIPPQTLTAYDRMVSSIPGAERKGATMPYTSVNGNMYSFIGKDDVIALRLPAEAREAFMKKYKTKLHEANGVVMKEYVPVTAALLKDETSMANYFAQAYEYVNTLKPKATTKKQAAAKKAVVTKKVTKPKKTAGT